MNSSSASTFKLKRSARVCPSGTGHAAGPGTAPPLGGERAAPAAQVLEHAFACPTRSLLCPPKRGAGSDCWRDDLHALSQLVRAGLALVYLPAFLIEREGLQRRYLDRLLKA